MSRTCPDCHNVYEDEILHCPEDGLNLETIPPVDELIGRSVGSYTVVRPLGKGGMGAVYLGEHPVIGSKVAIKFLHPQYAHDPKIVDRFFNEARAVNLIGHDNILKIIDLNVTEDNRHYFVMEFLHGRALQALIKHRVAIPLEVSGPILLQVCEALEAAHQKGIIHRDLKPDNVYLIAHKGKKNFVKVVDFGIARLNDEQGQSTGKTQTGVVMGTPAYMSPEQGSGKVSAIDARSDVYSLGVIMFQLATGRLPFLGEDFGSMLVAHLQQAPPSVRSLAPATPEEYERIILRCLEKKQEDRYQSMAELGAAIGACMDGLGISRELPEDDATDLQLSPVAPGGALRTPSQPGRATGPVGARSVSPDARPRVSSPGQRVSNPGRAVSNPGRAISNPGRAISNPGRAISNPGRAISNPGRAVSNPGRAVSNPGRAVSNPGDAGRAAPPPSGSKLPLVAAAVGVLILVAAGIAYGIRLGNQRAERAMARATAAQEQQPPALAAKAPDAAPVFLSVVSDPLAADVQATWKGGETKGSAPLAIEVPRNVKVHFDFRKAGYLPYATEVIADQNQTVTARLEAEAPAPRAEAVKPQHKPRRRAAGKDDVPASKDGVIDISDALK